MRKIMFNDRYDLTLKVLSGQKTQTRRELRDRVFSDDMRENIEQDEDDITMKED